MKGIFDPYVLWPFDHRPMGTPLPLKTCWLLKWIVTLELELSLCQLLCTPLYIGALSTVGADLELCTGVHDKMDFEDPIVMKDQLRSGRGGKIKENQRPFYFTVQPRPQPTAQNWFFNLGTRHLFFYLWRHPMEIPYNISFLGIKTTQA